MLFDKWNKHDPITLQKRRGALPVVKLGVSVSWSLSHTVLTSVHRHHHGSLVGALSAAALGKYFCKWCGFVKHSCQVWPLTLQLQTMSRQHFLPLPVNYSIITPVLLQKKTQIYKKEWCLLYHDSHPPAVFFVFFNPKPWLSSGPLAYIKEAASPQTPAKRSFAPWERQGPDQSSRVVRFGTLKQGQIWSCVDKCTNTRTRTVLCVAKATLSGTPFMSGASRAKHNR